MRKAYLYNGKIIPTYKILKIEIIEDVKDLKNVLKENEELRNLCNENLDVLEIEDVLKENGYWVEDVKIIEKFLKMI